MEATDAWRHFDRLRSLTLDHNPIGDRGAAALAASRCLSHLEFLWIVECAIGDEGARALADSPNLPGLRHLGLSDNRITDGGAGAFAESPHGAALRHLTLYQQQEKLGPAACEALKARFGYRVVVDSDLPGPGFMGG
jgi:hypothetical protein